MAAPWEEFRVTDNSGPWAEYDRRAKPTPVKLGKEGFADSLKEVLGEASWADRNLAGAGTALSNAWEGTKQLVGGGDRNQIQANKIISEAAPVASRVWPTSWT